MKRVIFAASVLILACALVSCGILTATKGGADGSIIINTGAFARTVAVPLTYNGADAGEAYLHQQSEATSFLLYACQTEEPYREAEVAVSAGKPLVISGLPAGEYYIEVQAFIGSIPTWFGNNVSSEGINAVVLEPNGTAEISINMQHNYVVVCNDGAANGLPKDLMFPRYTAVADMPAKYTADATTTFNYHENGVPAGKTFDYWTVDGDSTHYDVGDEISLNGKTLPIIVRANWKDVSGGGGSGNPTGISLGLNMITVQGGQVTSSIGYNNNNGADKTPFYGASSSNPITVASFKIADTELTYEKWYEVYQWATSEERGDNIYTFAYLGRPGSDGKNGEALTDSNKNQPVTTIGWRDAVVWCNAASEREGLQPVYYLSGTTDFSDSSMVIRYAEDGYNSAASGIRGSAVQAGIAVENKLTGSGRADNAVIDENANGYRLPYEKEWEFAARGGNPSSDVWNYAYAGTNTLDNNYAVFNTTATQTVKGSRQPNALNLYDMTGNVGEWVWDKRFSGDVVRVFRGGSYASFDYPDRLGVEYRQQYSADNPGDNYYGFRVAQNAN